MAKTNLTYEHCGMTYQIKAVRAEYRNNGTLAVILMNRPTPDTVEEYGLSEIEAAEYSETFAYLTVNLPESALLPAGTQFVNDNNLPGIREWLVNNGLAQPTDIVAASGFCRYRAFRFNLEAL